MRRLAPLALVTGLFAIALAYAATLAGVGAAIAPWLLALGTATVLASLLALAAARRGVRPRILGTAAALTGVTIAVGLSLALAAAPPTPDGELLLGLPRTTALLLLSVGLVPLLALPLAYAAAFEREVMGDGDG